MKKCILIITMVLITAMTYAQDVIVKKDGSTIISKVEEIGSAEIKYKKWSNQDGPMYTISVSDVARINFENGTVESFVEEVLTPVVSTPVASDKPSSDFPIYINGELSFVDNDKGVLIDGQKITDEELRHILGKEWYEKFVSARKTDPACNAFATITLVGGLVGILALPGGLAFHFPTFTIIGGVALGIGVTSFIVCRSIPGVRTQRKIIDEYNQFNKNNKSTSTAKLQIAPSIIGGGYAQDKVGLGMTVAINF